MVYYDISVMEIKTLDYIDFNNNGFKIMKIIN